jgi:pimeloyl-ACP methyl ester carboxylesterase
VDATTGHHDHRVGSSHCQNPLDGEDPLSRHAIPDAVLTDHRFSVPLDYDDPEGERIEVFAREAVAPARPDAKLPWLVFFQGGPGSGAPRPFIDSDWIRRALEDYRVLLLDQRGTGLSTPVLAQTLERRGSPEQQAEYLTHFRADAIARDAELIRRELAGDEPWSALGQSYGGFVIGTYVSLAPDGLREAFVTGGLPPLEGGPDPVYRATYARVIRRNRRYYERYPEDVERVREIVRFLAASDVRLPDGERLSGRRFLQRGGVFGMSDGFERVHYLLEKAFVGGGLGYPFLRELHYALSFEAHPIYAVLHEAIYCQGEASRWSAERVRAEFPEFEGDDPLLFTGEMIYPWMFDEYRLLRPLKETAELLAEKDDWPPLYDLDVLRRNEVPVVAAVYDDDMYVERAFSLETAETMGARVWLTNEYDHNALRADGGRLLDRLFRMRRGEL